jgi:hypothetical protein
MSEQADEKFLLLAVHYSTKGLCVWWCPGRCGYTSNIDNAGRYSRAEAESLAYNEGPRGKITVAVPESAVLGLPIARTISDEHAHVALKKYRLPPMYDAKGNKVLP